MNKKGYTLAEALITLGIIGIIAALVVPAANKARPNENKMKFLQTYDAIETQIKNFAQNSRYFPICQNFNDGNGLRCFPDYPLYNTSDGVDDGSGNGLLNNIMNGQNTSNDKLCYLLADAMGSITPMDHRCGNNNPSFITPNGVAFQFDNVNSKHGDDQFLKSVVLDVTGDVNFNNAGGENPSTFVIAITADGSVYPNDTAGAQYLEHRKDTREKFNNGIFQMYSTIDPANNDDNRIRVIFSNN